MMTPTRIVRMIGIAGLVGWMGMVGWVARTTQAQNGGQNPPALPPAGTKPDDLTNEAPETPKARSIDAPAPLPVAPGSAASSAADPSPNPPPPLPPVGEPQQASGASEPALLRTLPESQPAASTDDPEQSALSFVERNQKEAEDHLRTLTAEAQQLRARLAKLEAGIKKWQCLVSALKSSQGLPSITTANAPGAEEAGDLEPIKPTQAGGARTDKRVKWATATSAAAGAGAQPGENVNPPQQLPAAQPLQVVPGSVPR
jgi:hypothetical protein